MRNFPKRTGVYCWVWSRRNLIVFNFTMEKFCSLLLNVRSVRCSGCVGYLPVPIFGKRYQLFQRIKSWTRCNWGEHERALDCDFSSLSGVHRSVYSWRCLDDSRRPHAERFSCNFVSLTASYCDNSYERQPGMTTGACAHLYERWQLCFGGHDNFL